MRAVLLCPPGAKAVQAAVVAAVVPMGLLLLRTEARAGAQPVRI